MFSRSLATSISLILFIFSWQPVVAGISVAPNSSSLRDLALSGAPELAVKFINDEQKLFVSESHWLETERARLEIYVQQEEWQRIVTRVDVINTVEFLSPELLAYAKQQKARAYLELGQYDRASTELKEIDQNDLLVANVTDADRAELKIKLALETQKYESAIVELKQLLANVDSPLMLWKEQLAFAETMSRQHPLSLNVAELKRGSELHAYHMLSQLQQKKTSPAKSIALVEELLSGGVKQSAKALFLAVAIKASRMQQDIPKEVHYSEQLLNMTSKNGRAKTIIGVNKEVMWATYNKLGTWVLVNHSNAGTSDEEIYNHGLQLGIVEPLTARGVFSLLTKESNDFEQLAHQSFTQSLADEKLHWHLIHLYDAHNEEKQNAVPVGASYSLVDALLKYDYGQDAAKLLQAISTPADGVDAFAWALKRARVFVRYGFVDQGLSVLNEILSEKWLLDERQLSRIMQVGFDLQLVQAHDAAIALFKNLYEKTQDPQIQRELLFWVGDSHKAIDNFEEAGRFYLKSATLENPFAFDPWAQTARFQAAESLTEAGYYADAKNLYQGLYRATQNRDRRASIRQRLDSLFLLQSQDESSRAN